MKRYFSPSVVNTPEEEVLQKVSWWKRPEIIIPIIIGVVGLFIADIIKLDSKFRIQRTVMCFLSAFVLMTVEH